MNRGTPIMELGQNDMSNNQYIYKIIMLMLLPLPESDDTY